MGSRFRAAAARFWRSYVYYLVNGPVSRPDTSQPRYQPRHDGKQDMVGPDYDPRPQMINFDSVPWFQDEAIQPGTAWVVPSAGLWQISPRQNGKLTTYRRVRAADDTLTGELPAIGSAIANNLLGGVTQAEAMRTVPYAAAQFADMAAGRRGAGPSRDFLLPWSVPS